MKLMAFFAKIGGAGIGALGGLITFMIGLFSNKALAGTSTIGLALFGICVYLGGVVLESADFEELFTSSTTPTHPQDSSTSQGYDFSSTQTYAAPQQSFSNTQAYTAPQQSAPQQTASAASQQSYNPSAQSVNQSYQNNYSFDTPDDPQ